VKAISKKITREAVKSWDFVQHAGFGVGVMPVFAIKRPNMSTSDGFTTDRCAKMKK
jgi:hypothetical protein